MKVYFRPGWLLDLGETARFHRDSLNLKSTFSKSSIHVVVSRDRERPTGAQANRVADSVVVFYFP